VNGDTLLKSRDESSVMAVSSELSEAVEYVEDAGDAGILSDIDSLLKFGRILETR
jgi:hypothetical protein